MLQHKNFSLPSTGSMSKLPSKSSSRLVNFSFQEFIIEEKALRVSYTYKFVRGTILTFCRQFFGLTKLLLGSQFSFFFPNKNSGPCCCFCNIVACGAGKTESIDYICFVFNSSRIESQRQNHPQLASYLDRVASRG